VFSFLIVTLGTPANGMDFLDCKSMLIRFAERSLRNTSSWRFTEEQEHQFSAVFEGESAEKPETQITKLAQLVLEARFAQHNLASRFFMRRAANSLTHEGIYAKTIGYLAARLLGPHYQPVLNTIAFGPYAQHPVVRGIVSAHELTHGIQRNSSLWMPLMIYAYSFDLAALVLRTPIPPLVRFRIESEAIGTQWEITSRIPPQVREQLIIELSAASDADPVERSLTAKHEAVVRDQRIASGQRLSRAELRRIRMLQESVDESLVKKRQSRISFMIRKIAIESLRHASLSKQEFIRALSSEHGYDLANFMRRHYAIADPFRCYIAFTCLKVLKLVPLEFFPYLVPASDLKFIGRLLGL
jgi:hypothetical protein